MNDLDNRQQRLAALTRRQFVTGAAAGGILLGSGYSPQAFGQTAATQKPQTLQGNRFDLSIGKKTDKESQPTIKANEIRLSNSAPIVRGFR